MDQRERLNDFEEALRLAIRAQLLQVRTAMPVKIVSYDELSNTATCQPTIQAWVPNDSGGGSWATLPALIHVPVIWLRANGYSMRMRPKGSNLGGKEEGLVTFSERAIDFWWQSGGVQQQVELRHHDLSDGFVVIGPTSLINVPPIMPPDTEIFIGKDDGTGSSIQIQDAGRILITAPDPTPDAVTILGNVTITGTLIHG